MGNFRYLQEVMGYNAFVWPGLNLFSSQARSARGE